MTIADTHPTETATAGPVPATRTESSVQPLGLFERTLARRYIAATRKGKGISLISIIAFVGISLAVAVLIIVMSVMTGFRDELLGQLLGLNGHIYVQNASQLPVEDYEALTDRVRDVPGVQSAYPAIQSYGYLTARGGESAGIIFGIRPDDLRAIEQVSGPDHLLAGSLDRFGEGRNGGNQIAVGAGLAAKLGVGPGSIVTLIVGGGTETPMGTTPFTDKDYEVGAIFEIGNYEYDEAYVYMPLDQAKLLFRRAGGVDRVEIRIADPTNESRLFGTEFDIAQSAGPDYYTFTWQDIHAGKFRALKLERTMMRLVLCLIVLVAVLNIITGLVMLVKDKTSDIAVLRTMGATRWSIMRIFCLSGSLIGLLGTLLGVILGVLVTLNLGNIEGALCGGLGMCIWDPSTYIFQEVPAKLQWGEVFFVGGFAIGMAFLSTLYPAWRAANLDPVEALRYE